MDAKRAVDAPGIECATEQRRALAHPDDPVPAVHGA